MADVAETGHWTFPPLFLSLNRAGVGTRWAPVPRIFLGDTY
jgi:hypothetical protein